MTKPRKAEITLAEICSELNLTKVEIREINLSIKQLSKLVDSGRKRIPVLGFFSLINRTAYKSDKYGF